MKFANCDIRAYGPDLKIYIFRNGGPNPATWLKQNLCSFLSSKNCVHAPCMWGWLVWRMWLRPSWLFVYFLSCVFSLSRFFLVMMSSDSLWMEAGWLVWGRDQSLEESVIVLWLSSSQLPQHRLTIPNYPPSRLQLLILYSASFKSTLGTSSWPLTIFPLGSQKEKRSNFPRTLHWQYPNALMTRFQLILLVWSQTPPNFKVVIEWG